MSSLDTAFAQQMQTLLDTVRHQLHGHKRPLPSSEAATELAQSPSSTAPTASAQPQPQPPVPSACAPAPPPPWIDVPLRVSPPSDAGEEELCADSSWFPLAPVAATPGLRTEVSEWHLSCVKVDRALRCGACEGCRRADCGQCPNCRDKKAYGGAGVKKQSCSNRRCLNPTRTCLGRDKTKAARDATPGAASATRPAIALPSRQPDGVTFLTSTLADYLSDLAEIL